MLTKQYTKTKHLNKKKRRKLKKINVPIDEDTSICPQSVSPFVVLLLIGCLWMIVTIVIWIRLQSFNKDLQHPNPIKTQSQDIFNKLRHVFDHSGVPGLDIYYESDHNSNNTYNKRSKYSQPPDIPPIPEPWKIEYGYSQKAKNNPKYKNSMVDKNGIMLNSPPPTIIPTYKPYTGSPTKYRLWAIDYYESHISIDDSHNRTIVLERMLYWNKGINKHNGKKRMTTKQNRQFMTFWTDCGGWNNIRMGFEYMVIVAYLTNRTLVTPPDKGWYLVDWGQQARMKAEKSGQKTAYDFFFDFDHLNLEVPTMTTEEFISEYGKSINIPSEFLNAKKIKPGGMENRYKEYLNKYADEHKIDCGWGPLGNVLYWPSIKECSDNKREPSREFLANRKKVEYTDYYKKETWLHFPSCTKEDPGTGSNFRYLGQVSTFVWFSKKEYDNELRRVLRDHVHMPKIVFEYASHIVSYLGMFQYAALHIRRNELQYKNSFISAEKSLSNIRPLIKRDETIYIATDEIDPNFFKVFYETYPKVYRWHDLFGEGKPLNDIKIPSKLEGVVEMVVCGMGRIFFGTDTSTFTAYITRLRGYFDAPDKHTYHHNEQWTGNMLIDSKKYSHMWGTTYMDEFPEMWEDIKNTY